MSYIQTDMTKTDPLDACAGCRDLTEQLARSTHAYQLLAEAHEQQGQQLAQMTQERDKWNENHRVMCRVEHALRQQLVQEQAARTICDVHQAEFDRLEEQLAEATQELEKEHCDILVCTDCGRTNKHGWIGIVYESTPNSAEEYDMKCPECGSISLDEDARSVVNALDTVKSELAQAQAEIEDWRSKLQRALK